MKRGAHRGHYRKTASALSGASELSTYAANRLNQYSNISYQSNRLQPNSLSPTYDLNGNMTWDGTNAYFWDLQNQLILVSNAEVQVASAYDAMGRRVKKIVSRRDAETQSWIVEETRHFFYDGWNVIAEIGSRSSEVSTNRYVWGNDLSGSLQGAGGVGGLLAVSCVSSNTSYLLPLTYYPLFDHNGNVERCVSRSGATVASYQYDAFGNTAAESLTNSGTNELSNFSFAYRFSTKYWDAEAGLYYYGYRFYRPELGRWVNRDPIEESVSINQYQMILNNVVNTADIFGLCQSGMAEDDAGRCCCPNEMKTIEKKMIMPLTKHHTVGHEVITVCGTFSMGKYPKYGLPLNIYGPGEIKLDDDLLATVPKNRIITIKFKACPESVDKIVDKMLEDFISGPDYYSLVGVAGNSCVGWANEVLRSAGFSPPIGGLISTPGWASQVQPTSGTIIGISF